MFEIMGYTLTFFIRLKLFKKYTNDKSSKMCKKYWMVPHPLLSKKGLQLHSVLMSDPLNRSPPNLPTFRLKILFLQSILYIYIHL